MNGSFFTADRATHLKIGALALVCCLAFRRSSTECADQRRQSRGGSTGVAVGCRGRYPEAIRRAADARTSRMAAIVD